MTQATFAVNHGEGENLARMLDSLTTLGLSFQTLIVDILNLKKPQIQFPLLLFFNKDFSYKQFHVHSKVGRKVQRFPMYTLHPPAITSAIDTYHIGVHLLQLTNL